MTRSASPTSESPGTGAEGPRVLVVEDEQQIGRFIALALSAEGFEVHREGTGARGLIAAGTRRPDLVILDLGLPDMDGRDLITELRGWSAVPVVVLSARSGEADKVAALDAGADDYLTKPFGAGELLARVRAQLRRARGGDGGPVIELGPVRLDLARRQLSREGEDLHLTPLEYRLLALLVAHPDRVLTHRQILLQVWGPAHVEQAHYVRILMAQLRRKVEVDSTRPRFLRTESGVGYRFVPSGA
jgi:two-component system KDP operon response regulator KdpE